MQIENVSLIEVIAAARDRHASLVPESAGYLLLGVVRAMGGRPVYVDAGRIVLGSDGGVAIAGQRKRHGADEAAADLQRLLGRLLDVSQGKGDTLRAIADGSAPSLEALFTSITKALIPINRGAAKRALGRLARETARARSRGLLAPDDVIEASPEPALVRPRVPQDSAAQAPVPGLASVFASAPKLEPAPEPERPKTPSAQPPVAQAAPPRTPTPAAEVEVEVPAQEWDEIDADIELATPVPGPSREIELATPTPAPDAPVADAPPAEKAPAVAEADGAPLLLTRPNPLPVFARVDIAPFVMATPPAAPVDETLSPGTPTTVDGTLYMLSQAPPPMIPIRLAPPLQDERVLALSVDLPPTEPLEDSGSAPSDEPPAAALGAPAAPADEPEIEVDFSELPPAAEPRSASDDQPGQIDRAASPGKAGEPSAGDAQLSALEQEARLAQRLLALVNGPRREAPRPGSVEHLLERFGAVDDNDTVNEATANLKRLMSLDLTPAPADQEALVDMTPIPPSREDAPLDVVPSVSPPPVDARDSDPRLTPTTMTADRPPGTRRAIAAGSVALVLAAGALAFMFVRYPETLGLSRDSSAAAAPGGAPNAPGGVCYADLTLKDLPSPHEVLLGLGQAPLTSRPLPIGVRLELIALAAGYQPDRIVVPSRAEWGAAPDGSRSMSLSLALSAGETNSWPAAPAGDVGGIGPSGILSITAKPAGAEIWLVVGAGDGDRRAITVPCNEPASLLVVNPLDPSQRRRVTIAPNQLEAARSQGGAELSVKP